MCMLDCLKCLCLTAIQYYRKAVQLVPDIEFKIDEFRPVRRGDCIAFYVGTTQ